MFSYTELSYMYIIYMYFLGISVSSDCFRIISFILHQWVTQKLGFFLIGANEFIVVFYMTQNGSCFPGIVFLYFTRVSDEIVGLYQNCLTLSISSHC